MKLLGNQLYDANGNRRIEFSKGNAKYPDGGTWIINMGSAHNCPTRRLGLCGVEKHCYAYATEKHRGKKCINYRERQNYQFHNMTWEEIVYSIKKSDEKARKHHLKILRFNEASDFSDELDVLKLIKIAENIDVPVFTYTARRDLDWDRLLPLCPDNLTINGSGFMLHNKFTATPTDRMEKIEFENNIVECRCKKGVIKCDECEYCMKQNGFEIVEELRTKNLVID